MYDKHPGGEAMTRRLLELSALSPCRILDMGAGDGRSVRLLQKQGFDAVGIDLVPSSCPSVLEGDFLHCPFPDACFDAVLTECAFFVSGQPEQAFREAARLLKKGGLLLFADVRFTDTASQARMLRAAGLSLYYREDLTHLWKEYYLSLLWEGTADCLCPSVPKGTCFYDLLLCERM